MIDFLLKKSAKAFTECIFIMSFRFLSYFYKKAIDCLAVTSVIRVLKLIRRFRAAGHPLTFRRKTSQNSHAFFYIRPRVTQMKSNFHKKMINMRNFMIFGIEDS